MPVNLKQHYDTNWQRLEGYQMSEKIARVGYALLSHYPGRRCLDVGCGDGTNLEKLKQIGLDAWGCDISSVAVGKTRRKGFHAQVVDLNNDKLPYKSGQFDIVWLTDVIEHVFWPESVIRELSRITVPGGLLFISTPNVSWWGNRFQLLFGHTLTDIHPEHIHWYNHTGLIHLLTANNYAVVGEVSYKRLIPYPITAALPWLEALNPIAAPNSLFSFTFAVLARNRR